MIHARGLFNTNGNDITASGRNFRVTAGSIDVGNVSTGVITPLRNGGNINLTATTGNIRTGNLDSSSGVAAGNSGNGGNITLNSPNGNITTGEVVSISVVDGGNGNSNRAGDISIMGREVNTGIIFAYSRVDDGTAGNGGNVTIRATNGSFAANGVTNGIATFSGASFSGNAGTGGDIIIDATNNIDIIGAFSSEIFTPNLPFQAFALYSSSVSLQNGNVGNGGNIRINQNLSSNGNFNVSGQIESSSEVIGVGSSGNGGNININAQNLFVFLGNTISSSSTSGNGGAISLTANGNISTGDLRSTSNLGNGGVINLTAGGNISNAGLSSGGNLSGGSVNLTAGGNVNILRVDATSNQGNGGNLTLTASGDIGPIRLSSGGNLSGGSINLTASGNISTVDLSSTGIQGDGGSINLTASGSISTGNLSSTSIQGDGGRINLTASGNISTFSLNSYSDQGDGGIINLNTTNGSIVAQNLRSYSIREDGGNIALTAGGDIRTNDLRSDSDQGNGGNVNTNSIGAGLLANLTGANGGNISLTAGGNIFTNNLVASTGLGNGGDINLTANGDIVTRALNTNTVVGNSGDINLTTRGNIVTRDLITGDEALPSIFGSTVQPGNGGNITLNTRGNITATGNVMTLGGRGAGDINFTTSGNIVLNPVYVRSRNINLTTSGDIFTGSIMSGNINLTTSGNIYSAILVTGGGDINVTTTNGDILAYYVNASSDIPIIRNGGNINILATAGNIVTGAILSQSGFSGGTGGRVDINTGNLFLAVDNTFLARDGSTLASISTQGVDGGGAITITHGGSTSVPFLVGNVTIPSSLALIRSITDPFSIGNNNGTVAAITSGTGSNTINNLTVPVPPAINNYGTNISIRTTAPSVTFPEPIIDLNSTRTPDPVVVGTPPSILIPETISLPSTISTPITPPPPVVTPSPTVVVAPPTIPTPPTPLPPSPPPTPPALVLDRPILDATSPGVQSPISLTAANSSIPIIDRIPVNNLNDRIRLLDDPFKEEFQLFTGLADEIATLDVNQAQDILNRITRQTNVKPALIYVFFSPANDTAATNRSVSSARSQLFRNPSNTDTLEIVLVPPTGDLIRVKYPALTRPEVLESAGELTRGVARRSIYGRGSRRMYDLIVAPLEEDLKRLKIDNLVFLLDRGLRSMPIAAMQNKNNQFIIEDYSVALMPSLTLTDTTYSPLQDAQVMAMGADRFVVDNLSPLPGVPVELKAINQIRGGNIFLNENFTLSNLRQNRSPNQRIVHLATHGSFLGDKTNSFIQLWGTERLTIDQIRTNGFGTPPVDLLVLSACETALGNTDAELGFAGLAVTSGVRSALASLWQVSDAGTMGLMTEFYQQLQTTTTKSEALRQAQLAMLRGEVRLEGGSLVTPKGNFALNDELKKLGDRTLTHPYFWSAFTMIGNPW